MANDVAKELAALQRLSLQKDSVPHAVRLGAARAVLELGIKVREMVELEARIAALEAQAGLAEGNAA